MRTLLMTGMVALVIGTVVAAWAEVFPVRWDEPEPFAQVLEPPLVTIGSSGIRLSPDTQLNLTYPPPVGFSFPGADCTATNRGELRVKVLSGAGGGGIGTILIDALCLCTRKDFVLGGTVTEHYWSCFYADG